MATFDGNPHDRRSSPLSTESTPSYTDSPNSVSISKFASLSPTKIKPSSVDTLTNSNNPQSSVGTKSSSNLADSDSNGQSGKPTSKQNGGTPNMFTFSRIPHTTNIMDVIDILDDDQHISRHLSSLRIEPNNHPNGSDNPPNIATPSTSVTSMTAPTTARQAAKRSRISSDDDLIGEFIDNTLLTVQQSVQTECKSVSWGDEMDLNDAATTQRLDKDIGNFIPDNIVQDYRAACSLLEKRVKSYERLEFYQTCKRIGVIPTEFLYSPKVPQGVTLSISELVSWNTHIHHSELSLLGQLILTMKRPSAFLDKDTTKALLDFNTQLNDDRVSTTNVERAKTILSEKVCRERAIYKVKLRDQLDKITENYKVIKTNLYFLKNLGAALKNKPSRAASCSSSPTQRTKQSFVKKTSQTHKSAQNVARPVPNATLPLKQVSNNNRPPLNPNPITGGNKSAGQKDQTDTQTALLMQVVQRLDRQQEELNYLKDYPSLSQNRQRSRSP